MLTDFGFSCSFVIQRVNENEVEILSVNGYKMYYTNFIIIIKAFQTWANIFQNYKRAMFLLEKTSNQVFLIHNLFPIAVYNLKKRKK